MQKNYKMSMRLKTVAKLSVFISVLLFCVAVGFYAFTRLELTERNREVNLYSLVPKDCVGVLESNHLSSFMNELPSLNYHKELTAFQFPGLFEFLLHHFNEYAVNNAHGLSSQMNHLMVSFHHPNSVRDQVVYFRMGDSDRQLLEDMMQEYAPINFLPKEEKYRGKTIVVYPLGQDEFLATYWESGFMVLSFQKRLIEQVIDAKSDKSSLNEEPVFSQILSQKKSQSNLTLYTRSTSMPFMKLDSLCWSEYDFYMNSDVLYLTGSTYQQNSNITLADMMGGMVEDTFLNEEGIYVSANRDSTVQFIGQNYDQSEKTPYPLFSHCVSNLSQEAAFTLVTDMEKVVETPNRFIHYLPSFILENARVLRSFILSAQLSFNQGCPSHVWVLTYKN